METASPPVSPSTTEIAIAPTLPDAINEEERQRRKLYYEIQLHNLLQDKRNVEKMLDLLPTTIFDDDEIGRLEIMLMDKYVDIIQDLHWFRPIPHM